MAPAMQVRCTSCRGLHGSAGMQGGLRRGARGTALLGKACCGRAWCAGEGMHEGHALTVVPWLARGRCFVEASARRRAVAPWLAGARSALCGSVRTAP